MQTNIRHLETGRHAAIQRRLGQYGSSTGPTFVVIAGIHGNEPSGVFAFLDLVQELVQRGVQLNGRIIGLAGNLSALQLGVRFVDRDLNRIWLAPQSETSTGAGTPTSDINRPEIGSLWNSDPLVLESRERDELYAEIKQILGEGMGPYYFVDLHTTSSQSPPFMPLDDTLRNRDFVRHFPVPAVLGLEEVLTGTLLSYLNNYDVVTFGYEAGQHDDPQSIVLHREMLWCALQHATMLPHDCRPRVKTAETILRQHSSNLLGFYEVMFRYGLEPAAQFEMREGFKSFQKVRHGEVLARHNLQNVTSPQSGFMFMPLYQSKGDDGFFLIRQIPTFWLHMSRWMRRSRFEQWLGLLPGVTVARQDARRVTVNPRVARFLSQQIFHLLGYRKTAEVGDGVVYVRRDK